MPLWIEIPLIIIAVPVGWLVFYGIFSQFK